MCRFWRAARVPRSVDFTDVKPKRERWIAALLAAVALAELAGCKAPQVLSSAPPDVRPFGDVEREEKGVVASVHDTMIDLRTGMGRSMVTRSPHVPVGPVAVSLPVVIGGEGRRDVPGEEITVRMPDGKLVFVVQQLSQPPFAVGEAVKVQYEKPNYITEESRTRVVRAEY
jgi:hypothetical protein